MNNKKIPQKEIQHLQKQTKSMENKNIVFRLSCFIYEHWEPETLKTYYIVLNWYLSVLLTGKKMRPLTTIGNIILQKEQEVKTTCDLDSADNILGSTYIKNS